MSTAAKFYRIVEFTTQDMWYRIEVHSDHGKILVIARKTKAEAEAALASAGYIRIDPATLLQP